MPRSIWTGAISFGLVNVPVKLYTAVRKKDVSFNQLHEKDGGRVHMKRVCSVDGEEVPYEEIAKGYEITPGKYVMIDPNELDAFTPSATHSIDIEDFVDLDQIDPLFFDSSYYVVPDERGGKAYSLLAEAMRKSGKVGIAKVVMRTKQYLAAVRPVGDVLVLSTMNYADEVVDAADFDELPDGSVDVGSRELKIAEQLIESLAAEFDPEKYHDEYRDQVLDLIERKSEGEELVAPEAADAPAPVIDLMAALEASLAAAKGGGKSKKTKDSDADEDAASKKSKSGKAKAS